MTASIEANFGVAYEEPQFDDAQRVYESSVGSHNVVIGGGGGTSSIAPELIRALPGDRFDFAVGTADSGGSTGRLRKLYDVPAMGDGMKVIASLSRNGAEALLKPKLPEGMTRKQAGRLIDDLHDVVRGYGDENRAQMEWTLGHVKRTIVPGVIERDAHNGGLHGHAIGNLVLAQMMRERGDIGDAFERLSRWADVEERVRVMPSSVERHHLYMRDANGVHDTEAKIDKLEVADPENAEVWVQHVDGKSPVRLYEPLNQSIRYAADRIILPPASVFTTEGAHGAVPELSEALRFNKENGGVLFAAANLVEERDTRGLELPAYARLLGRVIGREIDVVVANNSFDAIPEDRTPIAFKPDYREQMDAALVPAPMAIPAEAPDVNDKIKNLRSDVATDGTAFVRAMSQYEVLAS